MLQQKTATKKEKKKASRKRIGLFLIIVGLHLIAVSVFLVNFFNKDPLFLSPLSDNQESVNSKLVEELKEKNIRYKTIETNQDLSLIVKLDGGGEVIMDPKKSISSQLSSLQLITAQLKIEGKTFSRLDFRYQKPVITF